MDAFAYALAVCGALWLRVLIAVAKVVVTNVNYEIEGSDCDQTGASTSLYLGV